MKMNREILFRAKYQQSDDKNDTIWVYGYLCMATIPNRVPTIAIQTTINNHYNWARHVIHHPETIGQYIGCNDIKGNKIFEGDLVCDKDRNVGEVIFDDGEFQIKLIKGEESDWHNSFYDSNGRRFAWNDLEVIGNIHDKKD